MKKILIFCFLLVHQVFFIGELAFAQSTADTINLVCSIIYNDDGGATECKNASMCGDEKTYYLNSNPGTCKVKTGISCSNGQLECANSQITGISYCCDSDPSSLFDPNNTTVTLESRINCNDSKLAKSIINSSTNGKVNYGIYTNKCKELDAFEDVNDEAKCVYDNFCSINNTPYCCNYTPPGTEIIESVSEDSFKGCGEMEDEEKAACESCVGTRSNPTGAIWTELGCIDPSPAGIITRIFQIGIGIMGGVIIIRLIQISLLYLKEDAQSLEEARDMITSLIMGLILLVGGVIILQFVGVNILGLPEGYLGG